MTRAAPIKIASACTNRLMTWAGIAGVYTPRGNIILRRDHASDAGMIAHEQTHHQQRHRDGYIKFWWRIVFYLLRYGYHQSPYEIEARSAQHAAQAKEREQG